MSKSPDPLYAGIINNLSKHISLTTSERDHFLSLLSQRTLKKKEILVSEGQKCEHMQFVVNGVLRLYHLDQDDNQSIIMFAVNDWWVTDMFSFATGKPAMLYLDALEPSIILQLHRDDAENLYKKIPAFERFFRIIMQNAYIREQLRIVENLSLTAEERYNNFLKKYPQFAERVPLKQIASYLGITPEFLSVIRKQKTKKK